MPIPLILIVNAPHREGEKRLSYRVCNKMFWHEAPAIGTAFEVSEKADLSYRVKDVQHRRSTDCIEVYFEADKAEELSTLLEKGDGWEVLENNAAY